MNDYQIPGFEFVERVGQGSFADVWKTKQTILDRYAAVKILKSISTSDADYKLFTQECQALARLERAPNIVQVFDAGTLANGRPYIVLEYVSGGTLKAHALKGKPTEPELLKMFEQAASGLESAHSIDVLHRDIKPENLLLRSNGDIVLSDFGVARLSMNERTQTSTNEPGTIRYMAPEVIEASAPSSERSDIYSLAATFWSVAAQQQPFEESTSNAAQVIFKATTTELEPLTEFGYSDKVSYLFQRCLGKDPAQRPNTSELLATLAQPQLPSPTTGNADQTILRKKQATEAAPTHEPQSTNKTKSIPLAAIASVIAILIGGFIVFRPFGQTEQATDSPARTDEETTKIKAKSIAVGGSPLQPVSAGEFIWVVNTNDNTVTQIDPATNNVEQTITVGQSPWYPEMSDRHLWVPNNEDGTVSKIDTQTGEVTATIQVGQFPGQPLRVDSSIVVPNEGDSTLTIIDVDSNEVIATVPTVTVPNRPASYESRIIVTSLVEPRASIIDVATLEEVTQFDTGEGSLSPTVFDDKAWVVNSTEATITVWDLNANKDLGWTTGQVIAPPQPYQNSAVVLTTSELNTYDLTSSSADEPITLGPKPAVAITVDGRYAWVTTTGELVMVDLESREVLDRHPACLTNEAPTVTTDSVWVACNSASQIERHPV